MTVDKKIKTKDKGRGEGRSIWARRQDIYRDDLNACIVIKRSQEARKRR
jgi:hypothetical protein